MDLSQSHQAETVDAHCQLAGSGAPYAFADSCVPHNAEYMNRYVNADDCDEPDVHKRRISYDDDDDENAQCSEEMYQDEYEADIDGNADFGLPSLNQFITRISSTEMFDEPNLRAKFIGPYFVSDRLGSGSYATVKECVDARTLQRFAIKILSYRKGRKIPTFEQDIRSEIRLLSRLHHPNVIKLFDILEKRKQDNFKKYLVLTYCIADMQHILQFARGHKYPEYQAQRYFRQTCDGLEYLHSVGIIHKDIKPGNLLIAPDDSVRITDFGVAELLSGFAPDDRIQRSAGTIAFQPPEVFNSTEEEAYPGFKLDVWSLGVTLYNITSGCLPFAIGSDPGAMFRLMALIGKAEWRLPTGLSAELGQLITGMMDSNVTSRYSLAEVRNSDWYVAQLALVGYYVNPNIGTLRDTVASRVAMFTEPDGTQTVERNSLDTVCRMSALDHLDLIDFGRTNKQDGEKSNMSDDVNRQRTTSNSADAAESVLRTLTSEDIEKEMREGDRKTNQLYARMNIKDDDLDEDTAEALMFTIRRSSGPEDEESPLRSSAADASLSDPQNANVQVDPTNNAKSSGSGSDGASASGSGLATCTRPVASDVETERVAAPNAALQAQDEKAAKKARQKKSPRAPSFCKMS